MADIRITARENGPYLVTGVTEIVDHEGRPFVLPQGTAIALCRCGHSKRKPFCDGTHKLVEFRSDDPAERIA